MDNKETVTVSTSKKRKPDEVSGLNIEARIKIFDPETGKIYLQGRA
jgi:hypothetical protein